MGQELINKNSVVTTPTDTTKQVGKKLLLRIQEEKSSSYKRKAMHGYFREVIGLDQNINKKEIQQWLQDKYVTSHFTAYACTVTKYLINKRQRNEGKTPTISNKCRLCKTNIEDITHIISACPMMSSRYYLPLRHDPVAKAIYLEHTKKNANTEIKFRNENEFI